MSQPANREDGTSQISFSCPVFKLPELARLIFSSITGLSAHVKISISFPSERRRITERQGMSFNHDLKLKFKLTWHYPNNRTGST